MPRGTRTIYHSWPNKGFKTKFQSPDGAYNGQKLREYAKELENSVNSTKNIFGL